MNNLLERFIKRNNKKRGINITVATIVMFLLSCTGIYAATIIDKNEKENILYVGANGANTYKWGNNGIYYNIDSSDSKLIINGRLEAGNNTQSLEISSNAKDVTVENNGFIDGVTVGRDYDSIKTNAKFINNGIITNEGNALVIYSNQANVSNYGIIKAGKNEGTQTYNGVVLANGATTQNFNNYGIVIDGDGKISSVGASNQQVTMDNGITYTVKNAVDSSNGTAQVITMNGTDGNKAFDKYILNGLDETIKVTTTGNTISNSVVNSLDKAINIESGAELGLGSTTVNGNIAINGGTLTLTDINNKINGNVSGTTDNDIIKLGYQVDSNTNYTNLNTILKGSGVDTLKFSDNGNTIDTTKISVVGKFEGGIGADTFIVDGANYTIDGGSGADTLSLSTAYNSNLSNFKNISNIETLQLANTTNEITIDSNPANFTTIKGGTGNDSFVLTGNSGINLIGGSGTNTLKLNNSLSSINYAGVLGAEGEKWNLVVNNLTKDVTLTQGNIKGNIESLKIDTGIKTADETTKLVSLLTTYNIENATFNNNQADILTFTGTDVKGTRTFTINQGDTVNMSGDITGNYNFKTVGTFTPTINLSSGTTFIEGTKITATNGINFNIGNGKQLTLGTLTYSNNAFTYSGSNPFDSNTRYTITGNIKLNVSGITGDKLVAGNNLGQVTDSTYNNNITVKGNIDIPVFLKYSNGSFFVKSWGEIDSSEGSAFLEGTYNNMLKQYSSNEAIKAALNNWSKDGIISYIKGSEITDYTFNLNGQTYKNTLIANNGLSKEFKLEGTTGGSITFRDIATSNNLTLNLTGTNQSNILLDENVNIGGDINFGNSENVNLTINARSTSSTVENILGNDKNSNIKLIHVQIVGNNSNDGKIDLGAGTDTLTLNNVGVNSITGSGKNTLELNQGSNVGTISLSKDSTSAISLMLLDVDSSIDNNITVNDGATVGTIDLSSAGNSSVTLNSGKITNVKFGSGNDMLTYNGGNISKIDFGAGDNVLNVRADLDLSNTKISVAEGGTVRNTLNVGKISVRSTTVKDYLTLSGDFSAFSNINIEGATKLESSSKLAEGTNINLGSNTLIAGINIENGTAKTVLSGANLEAGENSKLIIDTMKADFNTTISLDGITGIENVSKVDTNTIAHIIKENADGTYSVEANKNLISGEGNDLVNGIISSDNGEGLFGDITDKEAQAQLLTDITKDMMYSSPYAYSSIVSRKTAEMINNAVMNFDLKADKNQWLAYGSLLGSGKEIQDYYSGVNNTTSNINTDIYGAYVQAEYGYTDNTALGFVVGANKSDSDIAKSSLDGKGMYLGGYVKHNYSDNLQIIGGLAYQYNSYESDRVAGNSNKTLTYSEKYNDDTITGFVGGKYEYKLSETLTLQPNAKLNITHIMQDGVTESNKEASLKANSKNFTNIGTEIGADLVKTINVQNGKVNLKVGTSLTYLITGADKETMRANLISDNTKFDIKTPEQDKTNVKFKVGAQYEKESGVLYNVEGSYITSSKEKEWVVGAGIGYRF